MLFYSQLPNGQVDESSRHGACPVLRGTKLAANLWTWSASRNQYDNAPRKEVRGNDTKETAGVSKTVSKGISAIFKNSGDDPRFDGTTEVFYKDKTSFGKLGKCSPAFGGCWSCLDDCLSVAQLV